MGFESVDEKVLSSAKNEFASFVDVANPGEALSGSPLLEEAGRLQLEGTGFAAARAAGAAAAILADKPDLTPEQVIDELKKSSASPLDGTQVKPRGLKDYREMIEQQERELGESIPAPWKRVRQHKESLYMLGFPKEAKPNRMRTVPYEKE